LRCIEVRMAFTFLTAEWRKLIMAQYEVAPEVLLRHLPRGLELDLYQGRCFVSLVGFLFDRVRILGVPVPGHTRFEEVNLRYYVKRKLPPEQATGEKTLEPGYRRGVVFLSEIVPKRAITAVARTLYGEAYSTAKTRHCWSTEGPSARAVRHGAEPQEVRYDWKHRGTWQTLEVQAGNTAHAMQPGSLEEFITEHYWGFTPRRSGGTAQYAVEHRRWEVYPVRASRVAANFGSLYGPEFAALGGRTPDHVLLAEGAPVRIRWGGWIA
jgi:uncharacterized protein